MAGMSVSGLMTGLDVSSMVSQLMQVERNSGAALYKGQRASQSLVSAFTNLNTQMKALGDAAKAFAPQSVLDASAFNAVTAKSSNESIAKVTTGTGATAGSLTFTVDKIAQAGSAISGNTFTQDQVLNGGGAFDIGVDVGGKTTKVSIGPNAKLADVAAAINQQAGSAAKATVVQVASGTYKLQVTSATTGAGTAVNITNGATPPVASDVLGTFNELQAAQDTELTIGSGANAFKVTSSTKEVKDVLPGVTINPVKADPTTSVTVDLGTDVDAIASKMEEMVKAANTALSTIDSNSKWDDVKKVGGAFLGESTARDVASRVQAAFGGDSSYLPSMAGVELKKDGTISFDKAKFKEAYAKDATAVTQNVTGLAKKLGEVATDATDATKGSISLRIQGEQAEGKDYSDRIAKFEDRMTSREAMYKAQFSALDSMLSKMQAQGSWLQGQLAGLM